MLNAMYSIQDNLGTIKNAEKGVVLHLRSGQRLEGNIGGWSDDFVVLTELTDEGACDAVVRVQDISAVSAQAR